MQSISIWWDLPMNITHAAVILMAFFLLLAFLEVLERAWFQIQDGEYGFDDFGPFWKLSINAIKKMGK